MKYNKWTVALAALGVVSLASAAKAEEQASPVMTSLASTTISGYVDTSAQWNPNSGNENLPPYKFGGTDKADGFNLNVMQLRIDKPLDESDWAAGYRADLWFGPDANTLNTTSSGNNDSDFGVRQAYVALRAPVGTGLDFKMGVFDSIIGYESVESGNNPNFTRSYGHSIEPQTMTGLLASYRFCDWFSASVGIADTWGPIINDRAFHPQNADQQASESYKTYMGSIALTAPDDWGFLAGSTLYAGIVNGYGDIDADPTVTSEGHYTLTSYYVGATVATPVTGLRAGASFDLLDIDDAGGDRIYSVAGYLSYQLTEKLSLHGRAEYFRDNLDDGPRGFLFAPLGAVNPAPPPNSVPSLGSAEEAEVLALTGTVQYDLWKNVISRLEVRWDHSLHGNDLFGGDTSGNQGQTGSDDWADMKNAWMVALNVIYKF